MKKGWYHSASETYDAPEIIFMDGNLDGYRLYHERYEGPFRSFDAAKAHFVEWFKADVEMAKLALRKVRKLKYTKPKQG